MIAVDTNILVYAHRRDATFHAAAKGVIDNLVRAESPWAISWATVHEFLAICTNPRIYKPASPMPVALEQLRHWLHGGAVVLSETSDHMDTLSLLLRDGNVTGGRVHDARIAAICLDHGVTELWSADRDFARFPNLSVRNPLSSA